MTQRYDPKNIRTLLTEGLTDEELHQLCYDVPEIRHLYDELAPNIDKTIFVTRLILLAYRRSQIELILAWAKEHNSIAYEKYQPYFILDPTTDNKRIGIRSSGQREPDSERGYYSRGYSRGLFYGLEEDYEEELKELSIEEYRSNRLGQFVVGIADEKTKNLLAESPVLKLRLDVAVPELVRVKWWFVLAVSVRQLSSPTLAIDDLKKVHSSDVQVSWPEDQPFIRLKVQINAPDCVVKGEDTQKFRLYRNQDSPIIEFLLGPKRPGEINIVVAVYQDDDWLGRVRINTVVQERVVGKVNVKVRSEGVIDPLSDPLPPPQSDKRFRSNAIKRSLATNNFAADFSPNSRVDEIKEEILVHLQRLQRLKLRIAQLGIMADPSVEMEVERIEERIEDLQTQLKQFQDVDNSLSDSE